MRTLMTVMMVMTVAVMAAGKEHTKEKVEEEDAEEKIKQQIMKKAEEDNEVIKKTEGRQKEKAEEEEKQQPQEKEEEEEEEEEEVLVEKEGRSGGGFGDVLLEATSREGRLQYELLSREAQMPSYGSCYQSALKDLREGCSQLDDQVQSRLALGFTNCYLSRFGWPTYPCGPDEHLSTCMAHLDTRAASLYSSLLTSTLAMCHFLEAQTWRKSTARAVHSLKETSHKVTSQLDLALVSAAALRRQMEEQLTESRDALNSAFKEIRESAEEQRSLVEGVFLRVGQLHSLVMGEFSGINAVVFYVVGVVVSVLVTCGPRTGGARLPLLLLLSAALAVERLVASFVLTFLESSSPQEDIQVGVQVVRRLAATFGFLLVVYSALCFRDPVAAAVARLEELTMATKEIKTFFGFGGGEARALADTVSGSLKEMFEHSDSSDDTYNPNDDSDLEECLAMLKNHPPPVCNTRTKYSLRPRKPFIPNPLLSIESPAAFSFFVHRQESVRRRKGIAISPPADTNVLELLQEEAQQEATA